jgi:hypothetical protein
MLARIVDAASATSRDIQPPPLAQGQAGGLLPCNAEKTRKACPSIQPVASDNRLIFGLDALSDPRTK